MHLDSCAPQSFSIMTVQKKMFEYNVTPKPTYLAASLARSVYL